MIKYKQKYGKIQGNNKMKKDVYNLSHAQKSIWLTEQYLKGTSIGNITGKILIHEKIDVSALKSAIYEFVNRNASMRTKLLIENGMPMQYFDELVTFPIPIKQVSSEEEIDALADSLAKTPFSLLHSNLFHFTIFTLPNGHGGMLISIHHIIGDAWTAGLIVSGVMDLYESLVKNKEFGENTSYSYLAYLNTEKEYLNSPKFENDEAFWMKIFDQVPTVAEIPSKKRLASSLDIHYTSKRKEFLLEKDLLTKINDFCKNYHVSIFNFFMAIYAIYTNRVCHLEDFVMGTPILNRSNFKEKSSTGMYISTIPFKLHIEPTIDFLTFVKNISQDMKQVFRHQKYPYQNILQNLRKLDSQIPNLYDFLISYQNMRMDTKTNSIPYEAFWIENGNISDSLNIHLFDMNDVGTLNIAYDYQINKYDDTDIEAIHLRILTITKQVLENPSCLLKDFEILSKQDNKQWQKMINVSKCDFSFGNHILEQIEKNVKDHLEKIAIETASDQITYAELLSRTNQLANYLLENGLQSKSNIGIFTNRTIDVLVGILAILKIGATYVPIDPEYPIDRIHYMMDKASLNFILTDDLSLSHLVEKKEISLLSIAKEDYQDFSTIFQQTISYDANQNLYIVFTSGSTGNPKGVTISHKNMMNLIYFEKEKTNLLPGNNRILQFATMSFDVSYQEIFSSFLSGSTLVLIDESIRKDSYQLTNYIVSKQIDTLFIPPAYLRLLTEDDKNVQKFKLYLKNIITAGEQLVITKGIRDLLLSGILLHNHYGPAETHVATTYVVDATCQMVKPPIGTAISNTSIYILDQFNKICPFYTVGQIAIAGAQVGNGYFNNQELTKEKFLPDFFSRQKMYLTGDLGYMDENGIVYCLGRKDFQVKINGFRIELEEIDKVFMHFKQVQNAVSIILEENHKKHIVTYYTLSEEISEKDLYILLKEKLPHYMMPSRIVKLDSFPLTLNGKVDKKALPKVNLLDSSYAFIKPKTPMEIELASIWKEMFHTNKISTNFNFFAIGGDSLLAIKLSAKILDVFHVEVSVKDIFKTPVFSDLLNLIIKAKEQTKCNLLVAEKQEFYPLSSAQKRIYYTNELIGGDHIVYNIPGGLLVNTVLEEEKVKNALHSLFKKHSSFRTSFVFVEGKPCQKIEDSIDFELTVKHNSYENLKKIVDAFPTSFDLSKAPLFHCTMYILDEEKTLLLMDAHHIILDGTSLSIMMKDFCDFYNGTSTLTNKTFSYKDFAVSENHLISPNKASAIENYWLSKFENQSIPVLNLPYDYTRPPVKTYHGSKISKKIDRAEFDNYVNFAKSLGLSPYMFFLGCFFLVLYKYTSSEEHLIIGTPTAGRDLAEVQDLIGMFVNNVVLSYQMDKTDTLLAFLEKIKTTTIDALSYQPYPFDQLVKKLNVPKDNSRNPLFDVMFIYQNMESSKLSLDNHKVKVIEAKTNIAKFDLSLEIVPSSSTIYLEYATDLFKKDTIKQFMQNYLETLSIVCQNVEQKIEDVSILSKEEENYLLHDFNDTKFAYPENETISTLFEKQVKKTPDAIALRIS